MCDHIWRKEKNPSDESASQGEHIEHTLQRKSNIQKDRIHFFLKITKQKFQLYVSLNNIKV